MYRAGHYDRSLTAKAGRLGLKVPKLKGEVFESAVIERHRRREESVDPPHRSRLDDKLAEAN